jgi:uridine kinase
MAYLYRGGPLERGLQRVINDAPMGSLLVQSDAKSGEPLLLHVMLPVCIRERHLAEDTWVFLLDAQVRSELLRRYSPNYIPRSAQPLLPSWPYVF